MVLCFQAEGKQESTKEEIEQKMKIAINLSLIILRSMILPSGFWMIMLKTTNFLLVLGENIFHLSIKLE